MSAVRAQTIRDQRLSSAADAADSAPWLASFEPWFSATDPRGCGELDLGRLGSFARDRGLRLESGLPVRFVDATQVDGAPYETIVAETGCVPTRRAGVGMLHDWLNALCWLRWPAIKARLNRLQAAAIRATGVGEARGPLRDAITLFDESGALFVSGDRDALASWRRFDWQALFIDGRAGFAQRVRVLVVGHAVLEKLLDPYTAICAQTLAVDRASGEASGGFAESRACDPGAGNLDLEGAGLDELDRRVARMIDASSFGRDRLAPLPLLGVPGWWPASEEPGFYNDPKVFRHGRQRRSRQ